MDRDQTVHHQASTLNLKYGWKEFHQGMSNILVENCQRLNAETIHMECLIDMMNRILFIDAVWILDVPRTVLPSYSRHDY